MTKIPTEADIIADPRVEAQCRDRLAYMLNSKAISQYVNTTRVSMTFFGVLRFGFNTKKHYSTVYFRPYQSDIYAPARPRLPVFEGLDILLAECFFTALDEDIKHAVYRLDAGFTDYRDRTAHKLALPWIMSFTQTMSQRDPEALQSLDQFYRWFSNDSLIHYLQKASPRNHSITLEEFNMAARRLDDRDMATIPLV